MCECAQNPISEPANFKKFFGNCFWNIIIVKMVPNDIRFNEIPENWRSTIEMKLCRVVVYLHGNSTFLPDTMNVPCKESTAFALASRIHWSKIQIRTRVLRSQIQCNARVYHLNFGFLFCNGMSLFSLSLFFSQIALICSEIILLLVLVFMQSANHSKYQNIDC